MKSWKTTLFGAITAAGLGMSQSADGIVQVIGQIMAILGPVLLGVFAKDSTVTGGTVQQ
jgi:acetyl-CoA carboxylase carboxyltransferase component